MDKTQSPLRFKTSQIAYIAGVEQVRLQGWLDRDNIYLDAIRERPGKEKHRTYPFLDGLRIALIGRLVAHGMASAKDASGLVERLIGGTYGSSDRAKRLRRGDLSEFEHNPDLDAVAAFLTLTGDTRMYVWRDDGGKWDFARGSLREGYTTSAGQHVPGGETFSLSGAHPDERPDTYVFIHVGNIIVTMLERIHELGFIPDDIRVVTAEDLAKDSLYEGYTMSELDRAARDQTLRKVIHYILTKEKV
jgi:hypothetical protein